MSLRKRVNENRNLKLALMYYHFDYTAYELVTLAINHNCKLSLLEAHNLLAYINSAKFDKEFTGIDTSWQIKLIEYYFDSIDYLQEKFLKKLISILSIRFNAGQFKKQKNSIL